MTDDPMDQLKRIEATNRKVQRKLWSDMEAEMTQRRNTPDPETRRGLVEWACSPESPVWVQLTAVLIVASLTVTSVATAFWAIAYGYWVVPLILFIAIPLWALIEAYRRR